MLEYQGVCLRPLIEEDLPVLWELAAKEEQPEWKKWDAPYFADYRSRSYSEFVQKEAGNYLSLGSRMGIFYQGELVGTIGYYWEHQPSRWLEIGVTIYQSKSWGHGIGTKAMIPYISYVFKEEEVARVGYTTWSGNQRMIAIGERLGFQLEGRMRKCLYYQGVYYDSIRMGLLREEWQQESGKYQVDLKLG